MNKQELIDTYIEERVEGIVDAVCETSPYEKTFQISLETEGCASEGVEDHKDRKEITRKRMQGVVSEMAERGVFVAFNNEKIIWVDKSKKITSKSKKK